MKQLGPDRVEVSGALGRAPTPHYKVTTTYLDGYRSGVQLTIVGFDAVNKAKRTAEAILEKTRRIFAEHNYGDYTATNVEVVGAESLFGPHAHAAQTREVILRLSVRHPSARALGVFAREIASAGTCFAPGTTGSGGGRPKASPSITQFSFLLEKTQLKPTVTIGSEVFDVTVPAGVAAAPSDAGRMDSAAPSQPGGDSVEVPLIAIAYGRSGDKGDTSNIGLIARTPELLAVLRREVTEDRVLNWLAHLVKGKVTRYDLPGINAVNFLCEDALGGGGMASLRLDPLGKAMAQLLLAMPVNVPKALLPGEAAVFQS